jgi:hypothetical protein
MIPPTYFPPPIPFPSGYADAILQDTVSGVAFLSIYSSGICNTELFIISGVFIKIFEGYNGIYLYNTPSGVLFSTDLYSWSAAANWASSITQIDSGQITVLFQNNSSSASSKVYTQLTTTETASGWTLATTLSGTIVSDSAGQPDQIVSTGLPTLAGNNRINTFPRVQRNESTTLPIGIFSDSDAGIPQVSPTIVQITDLEAI